MYCCSIEGKKTDFLNPNHMSSTNLAYTKSVFHYRNYFLILVDFVGITIASSTGFICTGNFFIIQNIASACEGLLDDCALENLYFNCSFLVLFVTEQHLICICNVIFLIVQFSRLGAERHVFHYCRISFMYTKNLFTVRSFLF